MTLTETDLDLILDALLSYESRLERDVCDLMDDYPDDEIGQLMLRDKVERTTALAERVGRQLDTIRAVS